MRLNVRRENLTPHLFQTKSEPALPNTPDKPDITS